MGIKEITVSFGVGAMDSRSSIMSSSGTILTGAVLDTFSIPQTLFTLEELWSIVSKQHLLSKGEKLQVKSGHFALNNGKTYPATIYECENGQWRIKEHVSCEM